MKADDRYVHLAPPPMQDEVFMEPAGWRTTVACALVMFAFGIVAALFAVYGPH